MTEQEFIAACMAWEAEINGLTAIQPRTGINAKLIKGVAIISHKNEQWKVTKSPELLERFMAHPNVLSHDELNPFTGNIIAYKANTKDGVVIPGFVSGYLEYAKTWAHEGGGDFGGDVMTSMQLTPADGQTKEAIILSTGDGDIIIPPGSPNVIDYSCDGKTEILVLRPIRTIKVSTSAL